MKRGLGFAVFALLAPFVLSEAGEKYALALTPQQSRGKVIYLRGESPAGRPVSAVLGAESDAVPGAIVPCANCHGEDGNGKPEGGVRPAGITPELLARSLTLNGRTRRSYTHDLLKRAVTMGFDSSSNELNAAMPRYRMAMQDADDLLAYLAVLGHEPQPGVTGDALRIRIIGDAGALRGTSVYGRQIEFVRDGEAFLTVDASGDAANSIAASERERIPTIVLDSQSAILSHYAFSLTAGPTTRLPRSRDSPGPRMPSSSRTIAMPRLPAPPPFRVRRSCS